MVTLTLHEYLNFALSLLLAKMLPTITVSSWHGWPPIFNPAMPDFLFYIENEQIDHLRQLYHGVTYNLFSTSFRRLTAMSLCHFSGILVWNNWLGMMVESFKFA